MKKFFSFIENVAHADNKQQVSCKIEVNYKLGKEFCN